MCPSVSGYEIAAIRDEKKRFIKGHIPWNKGNKGYHSKEAIESIRKKLTGRKLPIETCEKMSKSQKLRLSNLREKNPMWKKYHTKESKMKMSEARMGITWEDRLGKEEADKMKKEYSERFSMEKNPRWIGGIKRSGGYVYIYHPDHPYTDSSGYVQEGRLVAERALGRELKRNELVHHINGIKDDNRNRNLLICDISYHNRLHWKMSNLYMKEHLGGV